MFKYLTIAGGKNQNVRIKNGVYREERAHCRGRAYIHISEMLAGYILIIFCNEMYLIISISLSIFSNYYNIM